MEWRCHLAHGEPAVGNVGQIRRLLSPIGAMSGLRRGMMPPLAGLTVFLPIHLSHGFAVGYRTTPASRAANTARIFASDDADLRKQACEKESGSKLHALQSFAPCPRTGCP
jgi:hypothetical protein